MLLAVSQTSQPTRGKKEHSSCAEQVKTQIRALLYTTHVQVNRSGTREHLNLYKTPKQ